MEQLTHVTGYSVEKKLGRGAFADVYLATKIESGEAAALKVVEMHASGQGVERLDQEFASQKDAKSLYVVGCREMIKMEKCVVIVMDYADGGSLQDFVSANPSFFAMHPNEFKRVAFQLLSGLETIHEKALIHRDIKPANILLKREGVSEFPYRTMLSDFGLAKQLGSVSKATISIAGTEMYLAPEELGAEAVCT